jgi:hypothetical protein
MSEFITVSADLKMSTRDLRVLWISKEFIPEERLAGLATGEHLER